MDLLFFVEALLKGVYGASQVPLLVLILLLDVFVDLGLAARDLVLDVFSVQI